MKNGIIKIKMKLEIKINKLPRHKYFNQKMKTSKKDYLMMNQCVNVFKKKSKSKHYLLNGEQIT